MVLGTSTHHAKSSEPGDVRSETGRFLPWCVKTTESASENSIGIGSAELSVPLLTPNPAGIRILDPEKNALSGPLRFRSGR